MYYTTTRGSPFPYNNLTAMINEAGVPIGYEDFVLDTFEAAALVTAVVAFVMGILHRNLNEATLFIWLAAIFYLRHATAKQEMDILISNVKKPSKDAAEKIQFWNFFVFFGLAATLYIQAKACYITARDRATLFAQRVFKAADVNHDDVLTEKEVKKYFKSHARDMQTVLGKDFHHWKELFEAMDTDGDHYFDLEELVEFCVTSFGKHSFDVNAGSIFFYPFLPAYGLALVAGAVVQGLVFDVVCTKGWVYQSRYYKEFVGGNWPWSDFFEAQTGHPLPLMAGIMAVLAVVVVFAAYNLLARKGRLLQLLGLGAIAAVLMKLNVMVVTLLRLGEIGAEFKGKENKTIRETKYGESLTDIADQNVVLLGLIAGAIVLQLLASYYYTVSVSATEVEVEKEEKKDQ